MGDKAVFTCDICGRQFNRRCMSHLKSHGIRSWEEYQEWLRRKQVALPPKDLVSKVASMILSGQEIPQEYLMGLSNLQKVVAERANALMDVAMVKRMNRLSRLLDAMDQTDRELTDAERVSKLSFPELLSLSEHLRAHAKEIYDEMKAGATPKSLPTTVVNVQQVAPVQGSLPIPTDPRERSDLLTKVKRLLAAASGDSGVGELGSLGASA